MSNRTEMLHFRATPEEKAAIHENAARADLALSEWLRQQGLERPEIIVRTPPDYSAPSAEKDERELREEVRGLEAQADAHEVAEAEWAQR